MRYFVNIATLEEYVSAIFLLNYEKNRKWKDKYKLIVS